MASSSSPWSLSFLSRILSRHLVLLRSPHSTPVISSTRLCSSSAGPNTTTSLPPSASDVESESMDSTTESAPEAVQQNRLNFQRTLENGLDQGVYKAILVGRVGQSPVQKRLKSGRLVTLFSLGTGGIRNNRRPLDDEAPREYAERCSVQWHRVSVYPERLGVLAKNHVKAGCVLYLEGNLETKIFSDPITGLVRRIREIAIRRDGRLVFISKGGEDQAESDVRGVGYF